MTAWQARQFSLRSRLALQTSMRCTLQKLFKVLVKTSLLDGRNRRFLPLLILVSFQHHRNMSWTCYLLRPTVGLGLCTCPKRRNQQQFHRAHWPPVMRRMGRSVVGADCAVPVEDNSTGSKGHDFAPAAGMKPLGSASPSDTDPPTCFILQLCKDIFGNLVPSSTTLPLKTTVCGERS
eukprot:RCo015158